MGKLDYVQCDFCGNIGPRGAGFSYRRLDFPNRGASDPRYTDLYACVGRTCEQQLGEAVKRNRARIATVGDNR
jgi:hypothetical protein